MADYFDVNFDKAGALRLVYNDTTSQYHGAHLFEIRQLTGKPPATPMADPAGDAQWPHYSPTGAGPNQPQLDLTNVDVSRTKTGLQFSTAVSNLATRSAPPGKTNALWLTRFTAKSLGTFGEEAYRIFYVGAESQLGGPLSYFVGSGEADTTTPRQRLPVDEHTRHLQDRLLSSRGDGGRLGQRKQDHDHGAVLSVGGEASTRRRRDTV